MNPFVYPKTKHRRRERPGQFSHYSKYKPYLEREFERKCVYCRCPNALNGGSEAYGVDHYRPKSKFPQLATSYSNLYYCCNLCNRRKGDYWPSRDKLHVQFIPNPCDHEMTTHVRLIREKVIPRTPAGTRLVEQLDLNDPALCQKRDLILTIIGQFEEKLRGHQRLRDDLRKGTEDFSERGRNRET